MHINHKAAAGIAVIAALSLGSATAAFATPPPSASDSTGLSASITNGTLSVAAPADITTGLSTTPGSSDTVGFDGFAVGDLTGVGEGWTLNMVASTVTDGTHNLPSGSLAVSGLATPTAQAGSTPASDLAGIASGTLDDGTGVNVADATAGEGMGEYAYDPSTLGLSVPRSAYAGAYSSTVTLTITQKVAP